MTNVEYLLRFFDIAANYFTLQLVRGAAVSVLLMLLVLALRILCRNTTFLKGLLWGVLLVPLFVGRLKLFYEQGIVFRLSWRWIALCMAHVWVSRLYFAGMFLTAFWLGRKKHRLRRFLKGMETARFGGTDFLVCASPVPPFTMGIFRTKIVLPGRLRAQLTEEELRTVLLHEKLHGSLGHGEARHTHGSRRHQQGNRTDEPAAAAASGAYL